MELKDLVGRKARRRTFSLHDEQAREYKFLFAVIDVVEDDMQDAITTQEKTDCDRVNSSATNAYNVYYAQDVVTLTQDFLDVPTCHYNIGCSQVFFFSNALNNYPASKQSCYSGKEYEEGELLRSFLPKNTVFTYKLKKK